MKIDETPEIIEILDDDDVDRFGDRSQTVHDTGGPRWVGPVAGIALIALIGYGVATSASTSSVPKVAPAPSTTAHTPATTVPAPTTTVPEQRVPFYAADPPREYVVQYVDFQQNQRPDILHLSDYRLWASPDATATSGAWFSIEAYPMGPQSLYATNAYRLESGEQRLAISHTTEGQTVVQASINDAMSVAITAFGWSDDDLIRLTQAISITDAGAGNDVQITDQSLVAGYEMITSVQPWLALQGFPMENIYYTVASDPNSFFSISVSPRLSSDEGGSTLDRQFALRFYLDHGTTFNVDGHIATVGEVVGQPGQSLATWIAGDHVVTVSGHMPVAQLVTIAATVHQVSPEVWDGMKFQATRNSSQFNGDYTNPGSAPVSFGTDATGKQWTISVGQSTVGTGPPFVNWQWPNSGYGWMTDGTAHIDTVVEGEHTYVLAVLPRAIAETGQLQVSRPEADAVLVPFVDTDPTFDHTFAAYEFSEPGPFTATIAGPDGSVLATWPTS